MAPGSETQRHGAPSNGIGAHERARRIAHPTAQHVLAVARTVLVERGFAAASAVGIEREAGVATGTVRYYFGTRDRLLEELLRAAAAARLAELRELLEPATTLDELEQAIGRTLSASLTAASSSHIVLAELATGSLHSPPLRAAREALHARYCAELARLLADKAAAGIVALPAPAETVATLLVALAQGLATETLARPSWDPTPAVAFARAVVRRLLLAPAA